MYLPDSRNLPAAATSTLGKFFHTSLYFLWQLKIGGTQAFVKTKGQQNTALTESKNWFDKPWKRRFHLENW